MPFEVDAKQFIPKVCPYFPPIITPPRLQGQPPGMNYGMCVGKNCAVYDSCQGDLSPRANAERQRSFLYAAEAALNMISNSGNAGFISQIKSLLADVQNSLKLALKPDEKAQ